MTSKNDSATSAALNASDTSSLSNQTVVKQLPYNRLPDARLPDLDRTKISLGDNDTVLVAVVFVVLLILVMLIYFGLFIYQRIRFPQNEPEDEFDFLGTEARNKGADSLNMVITKDELLNKYCVMDAAATATTEKTETGQTTQKADQDRAEPKRDVPSDAQSDASEDTSESVRAKHDFPTREEVNEVEDGPEKISVPSTERGKVRLSTELVRTASDDPSGKPLHAHAREEKKRTQYVTEYAEAYRLTIRREGRVTGQQKMGPLTDYNKFLWK